MIFPTGSTKNSTEELSETSKLQQDSVVAEEQHETTGGIVKVDDRPFMEAIIRQLQDENEHLKAENERLQSEIEKLQSCHLVERSNYTKDINEGEASTQPPGFDIQQFDKDGGADAERSVGYQQSPSQQTASPPSSHGRPQSLSQFPPPHPKANQSNPSPSTSLDLDPDASLAPTQHPLPTNQDESELVASFRRAKTKWAIDKYCRIHNIPSFRAWCELGGSIDQVMAYFRDEESEILY